MRNGKRACSLLLVLCVLLLATPEPVQAGNKCGAKSEICGVVSMWVCTIVGVAGAPTGVGVVCGAVSVQTCMYVSEVCARQPSSGSSK